MTKQKAEVTTDAVVKGFGSERDGIARLVMSGLAANSRMTMTPEQAAGVSVAWADALVAELKK